MLNNFEQQEIQKIINDKQIWLQKAISELQKGNYTKTRTLLNIESGLNIQFVKIIERHITEPEVFIKTEPELELELEETTSEDVNIEEDR